MGHIQDIEESSTDQSFSTQFSCKAIYELREPLYDPSARDFLNKFSILSTHANSNILNPEIRENQPNPIEP